MPLIDFDKLAQEFDIEDDFGFSAVSEEEYNSVINKTAETAEDYILSKQYHAKCFKIGDHYFGQDDRRFTKLGYTGMIWYMIVNFLNRNNLQHFEKAKVNYWD